MKIFITNVQFPGHWAGTHICKEASVQPIHGDGCHELFCQEDHQALFMEETGLNPVLASPIQVKAKLGCQKWDCGGGGSSEAHQLDRMCVYKLKLVT